MRALRLFGVLVLMFVAFLGGYALCTWRFNTQVFPALEEFHFLNNAYDSAQIAGVIDSGDIARAREKLLVRASVESKPLPSLGDTPYQWQGFFTGPFENGDVVLQMLRNSQSGMRSDLSQRLIELCAKSPDTKATRNVCNR
jgi:hypothetical protein